jgi:hypothetical protein
MPTFLLTYNPFVARVALIVLGLLFVVLYVLYHAHRARRRRLAAAASQSMPDPAAPALFERGIPVGSSLVIDILRGALILLAFCVAAGLTLIVLPDPTLDRIAQHLRLRSGQLPPQESISLLYLGDETKGNEFHIRGVVRNILTQPIEKLDAVVRLYAGDGSLIETAVARMDSEAIAPDATSSFHLSFPESAGQFASYAIDFKLRQGDAVLYKDMRHSS